MQLVLSLLAGLATAAAARPPPAVTVEEGGTYIFACQEIPSECIVHPQPGSMTFKADGKDHIAAAASVNETHCSCQLPPSDAEAPVTLIAKGHNSSEPPLFQGNLYYEALWTPSVARRPYLSTDSTAEVVLGVHPSVGGANVTVLLWPTGEVLGGPTPVQAGAAACVEFLLDSLLPVAELQITAQLQRGGGLPVLEKRLFLSRVAPPTSNIKSFTQVDYSRKAILVNGAPIVGSGFYDSQTISFMNISRQAAVGVTWNMLYLGSRLLEKGQEYLDWCHAIGMYAMVDIFGPVESMADGKQAHWQGIVEAVIRFREHPALLGWYVCDDCMTQWLIRQMRTKAMPIDSVYRALKELDPYHVVIGAVESADMNVFTQPNVFVQAPSLDVVMNENYVNDLGAYANPTGFDGFFRAWPLTWEPVVNCPGNWMVVDERMDLTPEQKLRTMYSFGWLSVVLGNTPMQLTFRLFPFIWRRERAQIYEDVIVQTGRYAQVVREVQDVLQARPSGIPEPWLAPTEVSDRPRYEWPRCKQCAALWRRDVSEQPDVFCAVVIVVNTQNITGTASFTLLGAERWPSAPNAPLRRVDGASSEARFVDGTLQVAVDGYDTHVYRTGPCYPGGHQGQGPTSEVLQI